MPPAEPPIPRLGAPWSVRVACGEYDVALVHDWMRRPHVERFWHQAWPMARWRAELANQIGGSHSLPIVVSRDGRDLAYLEVYRVARDVLAGRYPNDPHDVGVHIAIGDRSRTGKGIGRALLADVAEGLLAADPRCVRVVAEPDVANTSSIAAFTAAGFVPSGRIQLPDKQAELMIYQRSTP